MATSVDNAQSVGAFTPTNILIPTDFSPYSAHAMNYALSLAKRYGATLHIGHVVDTASFATKGGESAWLTRDQVVQIVDSIEAHADSRLDTLVDQAEAEGIRVVKHTKRGHPAFDIGELAEELSCDLVVIATHGRSGLEHFIIGSTTERVVRHSHIPVLTVKHPEHEFVEGEKRAMHLDRVLFPLDFSPFSEEALPYAVSLCRSFGAKLVLLYVNELSVMLPEYLPEMALTHTIDMTEKAEESLARLAGTIKDVVVETKVISGSPAHEIINAVESLHTDLIVIPTHGRTGLAHVFFGSVSEKVLRLAKCPVLTVRPELHKKLA